MKILAIMICWFSAALLAKAFDYPRVQILSDIVTPEAATVLQSKFTGEVTLDKVSSAALDSRLALERVREMSAQTRTLDVLLLSCGKGSQTDAEHVANLMTILDVARSVGMEVIWMNRPGNDEARKAMSKKRIVNMDYERYLELRKKKGSNTAANQGAYYAEALDQWWWMCAANHPNLVREKLWPGEPPAYRDEGSEILNQVGRVDHISIPEILYFRRDGAPKRTAIIFFPGGGYSYIGFSRNLPGFERKFAAEEIAFFALKYRPGRRWEIPLIDAERAVRWVRAHADELKVDPNRVGVMGISAGANLVLTLSSRFTPGNPAADDPLERLSSRPDFAIPLTSWSFGKTESPFVFPKNTPPVFLRHAKDDTGFPLAENVVRDLSALAIPLNVKYLEKGGHGAFDQAGGRGENWPEELMPWLKEQNLYSAK